MILFRLSRCKMSKSMAPARLKQSHTTTINWECNERFDVMAQILVTDHLKTSQSAIGWRIHFAMDDFSGLQVNLNCEIGLGGQHSAA
jgi:hypothetical protein